MQAVNRERRDISLAVYHAITAMILIDLYKAGKFASGPCNIGDGLVVSVLLIIVLLILLIISAIQFIRHKENRYFFFINVGAVAVWGLVMFWSTL